MSCSQKFSTVRISFGDIRLVVNEFEVTRANDAIVVVSTVMRQSRGWPKLGGLFKFFAH